MLISFFNNDSEMEHMDIKFIQTPTPITVEDRNLIVKGDEMPPTDTFLLMLSLFIMMLTLFNSWNFDKNWLKRFYISAAEQGVNQTNIDRSHKYVLITGCDRGLGYHTAKRLDSCGFSVIAGCLDVNSENVRNLQKESSSRLQALPLDVTSKSDLDNVKNWMRKNVNGELWGVVNNAGVCFVGTPELMAQQDVEKTMAVNFYGTVNVTKKFLPLIRRSQGRIVNVGSLNGEVPLPFFSIYNASKAAVKQFTESLSYELKDWGVKVSMVAPAAFKTDIITYDRQSCADKWWSDADEATQEDYGRAHFKMPMRPSARLKPSEDVTPFTDSIVHALTADKPKHIYRVGQFSSLLPFLVKFSPSPLRRYICGYLLDFTAGQPLALQNSQNKF